MTREREKYRWWLSLASGGDKNSCLLLYGSGNKSLRLPLSSVRGGGFADVGGIGNGILIDHFWWDVPIKGEDGSALDPSIYRGGQIPLVGSGGALWRVCVQQYGESGRGDDFFFFSMSSSSFDGPSGADLAVGAVGWLWVLTAGYMIFDGGGGNLSQVVDIGTVLVATTGACDGDGGRIEADMYGGGGWTVFSSRLCTLGLMVGPGIGLLGFFGPK